MNIQILNNDLSLFGIAAGFESVDFVCAFNSKGSFCLKINANNVNAKYIKTDKIAYISDSKIGYIDKVTIERQGDKGSEIVIAEGVELKDRLNRVIYPDSSLINDSYTDEYLETVIKNLINKNAGYLASASRQIPNLVTAEDGQRGEQIDYSAGYKDLSAEIYSLLSSQSMGLKAGIDFAENEIVFDVVQGEDRTAQDDCAGGIVLSLDTKTALKIVDTDDKLSYKNLSVTAGLGSGSARTVLEVGTEETGFNRCEVFTDARDVNTYDELNVRGAQKLSEISKTRSVCVTANNLGAYEIDKHYNLGDYISVEANGELLSSQVIKLKYRYTSEQGETTDVVLNFDAYDTLKADISAKHMDYDALVAAGASGMLVFNEVLSSQAAAVTIDNLNISANDIYEIEILTYAPAQVSLRINGDVSDSNYNNQRVVYSSTAFAGVRNSNDSRIVSYVSALNAYRITGSFALVNNNGYKYPKGIFTAVGQISGSVMFSIQGWEKNVDTNSITSMTVTNIAGNFGIGTAIKMWKK